MRSVIGKFLVVQLMLILGGTGLARELNVGDLAPEVVLEGVTATGQPLVQAITSSPGELQSYTIIEFFETENAESRLNLFPLFEISRDTEEYVATRLVAVNRETADVKSYIVNNQSDIRFPVHFDSRQDAMRAFGVTQVPAIFVLKNEKEVLLKHVGVITNDVRARIFSAVGY